ncbi:MAG: hypothetical protein V7756_04765 [Halopseudomonas sp.]|uniref:hypothetical protein n=1 Tax=Halopseudomonas sp. TaxID=2901191 RepID=UPI003002037A
MMNHLNFTIPETSRILLGAQLKLNGTFHHKCQALGAGVIPVVVEFEQGDNEAHVTVRSGDSTNRITLERHIGSHPKLIRFIEDAVNERLDNARPAPAQVIPLPAEQHCLSRKQQLQVAELAENGGFADFAVDTVIIKVAVNPISIGGLPHAILACGQVVMSLQAGPDQHTCTRRLVDAINNLASAMLTQAAA